MSLHTIFAVVQVLRVRVPGVQRRQQCPKNHSYGMNELHQIAINAGSSLSVRRFIYVTFKTRPDLTWSEYELRLGEPQYPPPPSPLVCLLS